VSFLHELLEAVIDAGATTVNIADTVGYSTVDEFGALIRGIRNNVPNIGRTRLSVHCHDDLGLAVANSLEAVRLGARQVECTVNGIGERAGNAALEMLAAAYRRRLAQAAGLAPFADPLRVAQGLSRKGLPGDDMVQLLSTAQLRSQETIDEAELLRFARAMANYERML